MLQLAAPPDHLIDETNSHLLFRSSPLREDVIPGLETTHVAVDTSGMCVYRAYARESTKGTVPVRLLRCGDDTPREGTLRTEDVPQMVYGYPGTVGRRDDTDRGAGEEGGGDRRIIATYMIHTTIIILIFYNNCIIMQLFKYLYPYHVS